MDTDIERISGNVIPEAARWRYGPTAARIKWIDDNYYFDADNDWGEGFGVLYRREAGIWVQFRDFKVPPSVR